MIERITENEKRLDEIKELIIKTEKDLIDLKEKEEDLSLLTKYYGSKEWFKDKKAFETGKIKNVKAGVLSEDSVWDTLNELDELIEEMKLVIDSFEKR